MPSGDGLIVYRNLATAPNSGSRSLARMRYSSRAGSDPGFGPPAMWTRRVSPGGTRYGANQSVGSAMNAVTSSGTNVSASHERLNRDWS